MPFIKLPTYKIKMTEFEIEFFQTQNGTRWSYRLANGFYHPDCLLLTDAMKHAEESCLRNLKNKFKTETKRAKKIFDETNLPQTGNKV